MGKDWAKGLTARTDPRIARAAAAHRGVRYRRRVATDEGHRHPPTVDGPTTWNRDLAYAVGLIATDGCLVSDGRHIAFTTCDEQLAITFMRCLGRPPRFSITRTSAGNRVYRIQIGDVLLYRWLLTIGLTPRKSLTLGPIDVPAEFLLDLVRGLLDGDGSIYSFVHAPTRRTYPTYTYERLWTKFTSASRRHLEWVRASISAAVGCDGYLLEYKPRVGRHPFFELRYGNGASRILLAALYRDENAPCLLRKRAIWSDYARRHGLAEVQSNFRPT